MQLLHIDSSILGSGSATRRFTAETVAAWHAAHPQLQVDYLDLAGADAVPHLGPAAVPFGSAADAEQDAISERLVSQFLAADVLVVGAPMYNFSVPSQLKAWIDRISQAGRTFRYGPAGPVGLVTGKTVIVVSARGGKLHGQPHETLIDHQEAYLRAVFGFLGITDIRVVRAEGLSMGPEAQAQAFAGAQAAIAQAAAHPGPAVAA